MPTNAMVYARTHSSGFVTNYIIKNIQKIIQNLGLDNSPLMEKKSIYMDGLKTWIESEHLKCAILEVYNPYTNELMGRFDFTVRYDWGIEDSMFWAEEERIKLALEKSGINPEFAKWDMIVSTKPGSPPVHGWRPCIIRPTEDMEQIHSGTTARHSKIGVQFSHWRLL